MLCLIIIAAHYDRGKSIGEDSPQIPLRRYDSVGWEGTNQSIGVWELRCGSGIVARHNGYAPRVEIDLAVGAVCRLRAETSYETGHLLVACWSGFGKRFCMPRGFAEHYRLRV